MSQNDERHILQATYQSNLIHAISDVIFRMNNNDVFGAYNSLETLYILLPKICYQEVKTIHDKEISKLQRIENNTRAQDFAVRQMNLTNSKSLILQTINKILLKAYKDSLESHNYLDLTRGRPPTKESNIQSIGAALKR